MPFTVIVTTAVEDRYRGFLSSAMLEIAPCVYTGARINKGVRERIWTVLSEWHSQLGNGSIVMTWPDRSLPSGQGLSILGLPPRELVDAEGVLLVRHLLEGQSLS